jgi:hypothetical protein
VVFEVQPEALPPGWPLKPLALGGFILGLLAADGIFKLFFGPLVAAFVAGLALVFGGGFARDLPSARQYRNPARFTVGPEAIEVGGRRIPRRDIQRIMLRNHMTGGEQVIRVHVSGDRTPPLGAQLGQIHRAALNMISDRVDARSWACPWCSLAG